MSYLLPHLHSGWAVDQAILAEEERVVIIRFGHDWDDTCMQVTSFSIPNSSSLHFTFLCIFFFRFRFCLVIEIQRSRIFLFFLYGIMKSEKLFSRFCSEERKTTPHLIVSFWLNYYFLCIHSIFRFCFKVTF